MSDTIVTDFTWIGQVDDHPELAAVRPTGEHRVLGQRFAVAGAADYEVALREAGVLAPDRPLAADPRLVAAVQAHWHAEGNNACVFASHMSEFREVNGWETVVLASRGAIDRDAAALSNVVMPRLIAPEVEVISVLLPHVVALPDLAALLRRLGELPAWSLTDEGEEDDPQHGRIARIGLRVEVEFAFLSEVLGFGPFGVFGATRRAPFSELAIRAKPPTKRPRDKRAFVAHYRIPGLTNYDTNLWWQQTKSNRAARLGPDHDERAKARVTLALPKGMWMEEEHR